MKILKLALAVIITLIVFSNCQPKDISPDTALTLNGDIEFDTTYLRPFLEKAEFYKTNFGTHVNSKYRVNIEYVTELENPDKAGEQIAGLSVWDTQTIYFNTNHAYWQSDARIILVYHELAHYFLNKVHIDESVSCDVPFSIMSLWSAKLSPTQFDFWHMGHWKEYEDYYFEEIFRGSNVWSKYPPKPNVISHEMFAPCWGN